MHLRRHRWKDLEPLDIIAPATKSLAWEWYKRFRRWADRHPDLINQLEGAWQRIHASDLGAVMARVWMLRKVNGKSVDVTWREVRDGV